MALVASAAGLAIAAYLDGKYQIRRDLAYLRTLPVIQADWERQVKEDRVSPWYTLDETCHRYPNYRALWTREREWTYWEMREQILRYAQWLIAQRLKPRDLVAIYQYNSAEYIMLIFAILAVGMSPVLVNYNLEGPPLVHCLKLCPSKILLVGPEQELQKRIATSQAEIEALGTNILTLDETLKRQVSSLAPNVPDHSWRTGMHGKLPFVILYTSGTTGFPKACPFTIGRVGTFGSHLYPSWQAKPGIDFWYSPMPFYHGTGIMNSCGLLVGGVGSAIPPRFSVSKFWPDVHDSGATAFMYVGETARYLLAAPPHPLERNHKLRIAHGNGLRPDVWVRLKERFNIPQVGEFFNSSEGVFALSVWDVSGYHSGTVGHHGGIMRWRLHNTYVPVLIDHESGEIWRDPKTGFAKRMPYDQGGEMLVAVPSRDAFGGYWNDAKATEKRFAVDVFKKGDLYYRSGDALRRNSDGQWFFLDRLGDTFRWKSENVSTAEVAETLGHHPGVIEANVYGVQVPGHEGRAGCAAIKLEDPAQFAYADLLLFARAELPKPAVPLFLRIVSDSSHIHNYKQNKVGLRKEGIDPSLAGTQDQAGALDTFLWLQSDESGKEAYVPFTKSDWDRLVNRQVRL